MKRRINPVVVVCMLIAAVTLIGIVTTLIMRRIPTRKQMDLTEYYGQTDDSEAVIIVGTQILEQKAVMSGEQPYLPVDVVDSYLNQRYYWDEEGQQILYGDHTGQRKKGAVKLPFLYQNAHKYSFP